MTPRAFGSTGITLSPFVFGSMRLDPSRLSSDEAAELIAYLADSGVNAWHSSHEYPHHAFFCETLARVKPKNPVHVMKLGEPHFDAPRFRRDRFVSLVEQELRALGTERISIVQWLLRATPNEDHVRLPLLRDCIDEVEETAEQLKRQGKIGALACFPYTPAVAEFCLSRSACAGLVTYVNPAEQECVPFLEGMAARGQGCIAIRPLAAGKLLDETTQEAKDFAALCDAQNISDRTAYALHWPLMQPSVSAVMLSVSSIAHAKQAVEALA